MPSEDTQFKPGQIANPKGRPKGAKNKLSLAFIEALSADFDTNGEAAIKKLQESSPGEYLRVIASVIPKDVNFEGEVISSVINAQPELTTEEWMNKHNPT